MDVMKKPLPVFRCLPFFMHALMIVAMVSIVQPAPVQASLDDTLVLRKRDYLELMVGNYVHGFKQFGSTVYMNENTLQIDVFYGADQGKLKALRFKRHLEKEMPYVLNKYDWSSQIAFEISIFPEQLISQ